MHVIPYGTGTYSTYRTPSDQSSIGLTAHSITRHRPWRAWRTVKRWDEPAPLECWSFNSFRPGHHTITPSRDHATDIKERDSPSMRSLDPKPIRATVRGHAASAHRPPSLFSDTSAAAKEECLCCPDVSASNIETGSISQKRR